MATEKTKKLLDKLNDITTTHKDLNTPKTIPTSNIMWVSVLDMYDFPKHYDKVKKHKEVDEDGVEDSWFYYDRIYGASHTQRLIQADGSEYQGKIYDRRKVIKREDGTKFYTRCHQTADGRWFDGSGMPMTPPTEIDNEQDEKQIPEEAQSEEKETGSQE